MSTEKNRTFSFAKLVHVLYKYSNKDYTMPESTEHWFLSKTNVKGDPSRILKGLTKKGSAPAGNVPRDTIKYYNKNPADFISYKEIIKDPESFIDFAYETLVYIFNDSCVSEEIKQRIAPNWISILDTRQTLKSNTKNELLTGSEKADIENKKTELNNFLQSLYNDICLIAINIDNETEPYYRNKKKDGFNNSFDSKSVFWGFSQNLCFRDLSKGYNKEELYDLEYTEEQARTDPDSFYKYCFCKQFHCFESEIMKFLNNEKDYDSFFQPDRFSIIQDSINIQPSSIVIEAETDVIQLSNNLLPSINEILPSIIRYNNNIYKNGRMTSFFKTEVRFDMPKLGGHVEGNSAEESLYDSIIENGSLTKNICLTGLGGIGKTFMLIDLAERLLSDPNTKIIPIYIPLNDFASKDYSDFLKVNSNESIIIEYLKAQISHNEDEKKALDAFLHRDILLEKHPLILLDGINELSDSALVDKIVSEVFDLSQLDIHFIITSRYDLSKTFRSSVSPFEMRHVKPLNTDTVKLTIEQIKEGTYDNIPAKMKSILCYPMALQMYCMGLNYDIASDYEIPYSKATNLGTLLANYTYLVLSNTLDSIKVLSIDKCLSEIAFFMYKNSSFTTISDDLIELCQKLELQPNELTSTSLIMSTTINDKKHYKFAHQYIRDYYVALYAKLQMDAVRNGEKTLQDIIDLSFISSQGSRFYNDEVLALLGDLIVQNNKDYLDLFRNHFGDKSIQLSVAQVIDALKLTNDKNLGSIDLSHLDLSLTNLNYCHLYTVKDDLSTVPAYFAGCRISPYTFSTTGHSAAVFCMAKITDNFIISFSRHNVLSYNLRTKQTIAAYVFNNDDEYLLYHSVPNTCLILHSNEEILVGYNNGILAKWNYSVIKGRIILSNLRCINCNINDDNNTIISNIVSLVAKDNNTFYAASAEGFLYTISGETIINITKCPTQNETIINHRCTLHKLNCGIVIVSYDKTAYVLGNYQSPILDLTEMSFSNTDFYKNNNNYYIYDITSYDDSIILINIRGKVSSVIIEAELHINTEGTSISGFHITGYHLYKEHNSSGFKGYNHFFSAGNSSQIYICTNDISNEVPDLYSIILEKKNILSGYRVKMYEEIITDHKLSVNSGLCINDDIIATCSTDRSIHITNRNNDGKVTIIPGYYNGIHNIVLLDNSLILLACYSGEVALYSVSKRHFIRIYNYHNSWVSDLDYCCLNGNIMYYASSSYDNHVMIVDISTEKAVIDFMFDSIVHSVSFTDTNDVLALTDNALYLCHTNLSDKSSNDECIISKCSYNDALLKINGGYLLEKMSSKPNSFLLICNENKNGDTIPSIKSISIENDTIVTLTDYSHLFESHTAINCTAEIMHNNSRFLAFGGKDHRNEDDLCYIYSERHDKKVCVPLCEGRNRLIYGVYSLTFCVFDNQLYLFTVSRSGCLCIYLIITDWEHEDFSVQIVYSQVYENQILDVQIKDDDIYYCTLDGYVYHEDVSEILKTVSRVTSRMELYEDDILKNKPIVKHVCGYQMLNCNLSPGIVTYEDEWNMSDYYDIISQYAIIE